MPAPVSPPLPGPGGPPIQPPQKRRLRPGYQQAGQLAAQDRANPTPPTQTPFQKIGQQVADVGSTMQNVLGGIQTQGQALQDNIASAAADQKLQEKGGIVGTGSAAIIDAAKKLLGTPYVWGGESRNGVDCSGLVQWAARKVGINLPRTSTEMAQAVPHINNKADLQPGDLMFYTYKGGPVSHVNIYVGHGQVISADHPGPSGTVRIEPVDWSAWLYGGRLSSGKRH